MCHCRYISKYNGKPLKYLNSMISIVKALDGLSRLSHLIVVITTISGKRGDASGLEAGGYS